MEWSAGSWVCPEHGRQETPPPSDQNLLALAERLPFPLAAVLSEYVDAVDAFIKVHRLADASEILSRFMSMVLLSDVLRQHSEFPESIRSELHQQLERPTFGAWKNLLEHANLQLPKQGGRIQCFIPELPDFVNSRLLPALGSGGGDPHREIIALRNSLVHAGRVSDAQAAEWLQEHQEQFEGLFAALGFLSDYSLIASNEDGQLVALTGSPDEDGSFPQTDSPSLAIQLLPGRVLLVRGSEVLDLFPLHAFGDVFHNREDALERVDDASPQLYFRSSDKGYLEFTTLSGRVAFGQQRGAALERFREIFRLEEWRARSKGPDPRAMFVDLLAELGEVFVGRSDDIRIVKEHLKACDHGVLWISGKPGVGKSALLARLVDDYAIQSQHYLTIPYFFRIGHASCSTDQFLSAAVGKLLKELGDSSPIAPKLSEKRQQFADAVREAAVRTGRKVLFLVDGLDEIHRLDPGFVSLLATAATQHVVWVCAGRAEEALEELLRRDGAEWVFPEGLPQLGENALRAMLVAHLDQLKYELFERDEGERNRFVEILTKRSEGLPLYVRMVVEDLREGKRTLDDEKSLPNGLQAYFEQVLQRMHVSDVGTVLTPLFCLLSWAREPVTPTTLRLLLSDHFLAKTSRWPETVQKAFEHGHLMLRIAVSPDGWPAWTLYHDSFRQHLQTTDTVIGSREWAQAQWVQWCGQWHLAIEEGLTLYSLRHYPDHLYESSDWETLFALVDNEEFLDAQEHALPNEPDAPLRTLSRALDGAILLDDPVRMARYMLKHARHRTAIAEESPLSALRDGRPERAWDIVDLMPANRRILFYLLLAWELCDSGQDKEAVERLTRLLEDPIPRLRFDDEEHAVDLLLGLKSIEREIFVRIASQSLGDDDLQKLCERLAHDGFTEHAVACARFIAHARTRAEALVSIAIEVRKRGEKNTARDLLLQAVDVLERDDDKWPTVTVRVWGDIACELASLGDVAVAQRAFDSGRAVAAAFSEADDKARAQRDVAIALGKARWFYQALELAHQISGPDLYTRQEAIAAIAIEQAQAGEVASAVAALKSLWPVLIEYPGAARAIAFEQARLGEFAGARETLQTIEDPDQRWGLDRVIAVEQARRGDPKEGWQTARSIQRASSRVGALLDVANALDAERGNLIAALCIQSALAAVSEVSSELDRALLLADIGKVEAHVGDRDRAKTRFAAALAATSDDNDIDASRRVTLEIAEESTAVEFFEIAQSALEHAQSLAGNVRGEQKMKHLWEVGRVWSEIGNSSGARTVFGSALQADDSESYLRRVDPERIGVEKARVNAMAKLAGRLQALGQPDGAERLFFEAMHSPTTDDDGESMWTVIEQFSEAGQIQNVVEILDTVDDNAPEMFGALMALGKGAGRAGHPEAAHALFSQVAETMLEKVGVLEDVHGVEAVTAIALAQVDLGNIDAALGIADQLPTYWPFADNIRVAVARHQAITGNFAAALTTADQIHKYVIQHDALRDVAVAQARSGLPDRAQTTFAMAATAAHGIGEAPETTKALLSIAEAQVSVGFSADATNSIMEAMESASLLGIDWRRDELLVDAAKIFAELNDYDRSRAVIESIESDWHQSAAWCSLAEIFANTQDWGNALSIADGIESPWWRSAAIAEIASRQLQSLGRTDPHDLVLRALALSQDIPQGEARERLFARCIATFVNHGAYSQAVEVAQLMVTNVSEHVPHLATKLAEAEDIANVKRLLVICADHEDAAYRMFDVVAELYPNSTESLAKVLSES